MVKSVVFATFWQGLLISAAVNGGLLYDGAEARALSNFLLCVEMIFASVGSAFCSRQPRFHV